MSDDLREALTSAVEADEAQTVADTQPAVTETVTVSESESDTPPSETSTETIPEATSTSETTSEPVSGEAAPSPSDKFAKPPAAWKGDAKGVWADLPLNVRSEVMRRERDVQNTMQNASHDRKMLGEVQNVLSPHMARIGEIYGGNPMTAIDNMMRIEKTLFTSSAPEKAQLVASIIQKFGIDVNMLDTLLSGNQLDPADRNTIEMNQRFNQIQQQLNQVTQAPQQQYQQQNNNAVVSEIDQMMNDSKNYPHFDDVRMEMADLIEVAERRGVALSLKDAYSKATVIAGYPSNSNTSSALAAHAAAQKAKIASASVSGSPVSTGKSTGNPNDLRAMISSAMGDSSGRV